jgi:hypothetical protein
VSAAVAVTANSIAKKLTTALPATFAAAFCKGCSQLASLHASVFFKLEGKDVQPFSRGLIVDVAGLQSTGTVKEDLSIQIKASDKG